MKKLLLIPLLALFAGQALRANSEADVPRSTLLTRVHSCEAILEEFQDHPAEAIPPAVWARAKGILILNQFQGGFIFGVKGGYGILMVKRPNGTWSLPVLVSTGEASLGLQLGAKSVETICIITDDQTPRLLFKNRANLGVDAKAVIGPKAAEAEKFTKSDWATPLLVYTHAKGLYAGATIKVGQVARNDEANFTLYNTQYTLPEILYSDWIQTPPDIYQVINLVKLYAP
jgi:lipid-binding SYLF domain-containing protein